jgi:hypothetical protein
VYFDAHPRAQIDPSHLEIEAFHPDTEAELRPSA